MGHGPWGSWVMGSTPRGSGLWFLAVANYDTGMILGNYGYDMIEYIQDIA